MQAKAYGPCADAARPAVTIEVVTGGETARIELPQPADERERNMLNAVMEAAEADRDDESQMACAMTDLYFALDGLQHGTSATVARTRWTVIDALLHLEGVVGDGSPLYDRYVRALEGGEHDAEALVAEREKFRQAVRSAEQVLDVADVVLAE